jgi:hypothetical protein
MSRTFVTRLFAGALFFLGCWIAYTQNQNKQPPSLTLNKVKDDLYEIEGDGGNVAVYITNEGVILIDDKYDQEHNQPADQIHPEHALSRRPQRREHEVSADG